MSLVSGNYFISNVATTTYLGLGPASGIRFPVINSNEMTPNVTVRTMTIVRLKPLVLTFCPAVPHLGGYPIREPVFYWRRRRDREEH